MVAYAVWVAVVLAALEVHERLEGLEDFKELEGLQLLLDRRGHGDLLVWPFFLFCG